METYKLQIKYSIPEHIQFTPIPPNIIDAYIAKHQTVLEASIFSSLGIPPGIFQWSQPEWVSQVIRIPENRIRQILGE